MTRPVNSGLVAAGITDVGLKRTNNEDVYLVDEELGLYAVADGMGGHQAGEVASRVAVDALQERLRLLHKGAAGVENPDGALSRAGNMMADAFQYANRAVKEEAGEVSGRIGMGCTLSAVWLNGFSCVAANVGDSPILLVRNGTAEPLAVMHTVGDQQEALGINPNAQPDPRAYNILTQAMGREGELQPEITETPTFPGDRLVLCTDGLSKHLDTGEIVAQSGDGPPETACRTLVEAALERGGSDNVTVVVVSFVKKSWWSNMLERLQRIAGR